VNRDDEHVPDLRAGEAVVVVGASAGGVEALVQFVASIPPAFPHGVLVVLHVAPTTTSFLRDILARSCVLPAVSPADGESLQPAHVYVARPNAHLMVEDGRLRLSQEPRENGHRPAIDPTMRSAARAYGARAIGIVLSGSRDDGTAGLMAIKAAGGTALVQDPEESLYPSMPRSALAHVDVDAVLGVREMARWIMARDRGGVAVPALDRPDGDDDAAEAHAGTGEGTRFTCPDCGGVLFEHHEGGLERFKCSVGHVFTIDSLATAQAEGLEGALWAAVRSLEDRAALLTRLATRVRASGHRRSAATFEAQAEDAHRRANTIRAVIQASDVGDEEVAQA
jgi:two-component system, chemotaxis family, protein-glutamate methylesterase/glutaminase